MEGIRIVLLVIMWILIAEFGCNFIMQTVSYSFYKGNRKMDDISCEPQYIQMSEKLTGYGYNLDADSNKVILFFGGSNYIAYNSVGKFADKYNCPFISIDYYGTQDSKGKMNLKTMQQSSTDMYDWVKNTYPSYKIIVIGHSYGTGIAAYLASARKCDELILAAGYRDLSDLYNKMIPIFWGPLKVFISNNINTSDYAKSVNNPVYIIGSNADKTLSVSLQKKVAQCFNDSRLKVFDNISHENYFISNEVIDYVNGIIAQA